MTALTGDVALAVWRLDNGTYYKLIGKTHISVMNGDEGTLITYVVPREGRYL